MRYSVIEYWRGSLNETVAQFLRRSDAERFVELMLPLGDGFEYEITPIVD